MYAAENGLPIVTAGSDYHHPNRRHEGVAALRSDRLPADSFDLAARLKSGHYLLEIGRNHLVIP